MTFWYRDAKSQFKYRAYQQSWRATHIYQKPMSLHYVRGSEYWRRSADWDTGGTRSELPGIASFLWWQFWWQLVLHFGAF
jgi:hypothetical protein